MGKKWDKNYIRIGIVLTISICICITFNEVIKQWHAMFAWIGKLFSAMTPIIIGIVIAYLLNPIMIYLRRFFAFAVSKIFKEKTTYDKAYKKTKVPALVVTVLAFLGLLTLFLYLVIPSLYTSITDLVTQTPTYLDSLQTWVEKMFAKNEFLEEKLSSAIDYLENNVFAIFQEKVMPNLDTIALAVSSGVVVGVKAVFNFLIGIIVAIYLLISKDVLLAQGKKLIYLLFSRKNGNKILKGFAYANTVFGGFINGKIIDSIIIGILCFIFTNFVGMTYAVLISVIVGMTNIIPFFGPFIGAVPGALLALMDDPLMCVIFIVWIIVLQQFDGNILGPLILGDATGLSSVWILVAILVGGDLFGVVGMIIGVPIFACIYAFCAVQMRDGLRRKNMSSKTEDYFRLIGFDEKTGEPLYREEHEVRRTLRQTKRKSILTKKLDKYKIKKNQSEEAEQNIASKEEAEQNTDSDAETKTIKNNKEDIN